MEFDAQNNYLDETTFIENEEDQDEKQQNEEEQQQFSCRLESNKVLIELLISLSLDTTKDYECFIEATPEGLNFL
jgi:hypothetical protein